jgi:hypothetical protein
VVSAPAPVPAPAPAAVSATPSPFEQPAAVRGTSGLLIAGWAGTGALAAGGVVTGILASSAADRLDRERHTFPGDKSKIDSAASRTTMLSVTTDVLFASALVLGGVSLYFTLRHEPVRAAARVPVPSAIRVGVGPRAFAVAGAF